MSYFFILLVVFFAASNAAQWNDLGKDRVPMGWNTWCTMSRCWQHEPSEPNPLQDVCNEREIKEIAQAMIDSGMQAAGYNRVNLDDCWQAPIRNASTGEIYADSARFPSGLKDLAKWLHDRGFLFGIYISLGNETCSKGGRFQQIVGSLGHYALDAATMAKNDVDYIKADWCGAWHLKPEPQTNELAQAMAKLERKMWLNFHCIQGDGATGEYCIKDGNSFRIAGDHHDKWSNTKGVIDVISDNAITALGGPGHWIDADFLYTGGGGTERACMLRIFKLTTLQDVLVRRCICFARQFKLTPLPSGFTPGLRCPGQTEDEYTTTASLWALVSSSWLVSSDVRRMSAFQRRVLLNRDLLGVVKTYAGDAGGMRLKVPCASAALPASLRVFVKRLTSDGTRVAVGVFNENSDACAAVDAISLKLLHINAEHVKARSVWSERNYEIHDGQLRVEHLCSHATELVILEAK